MDDHTQILVQTILFLLGLVPLTLCDDFQATWKKTVTTKISYLGFSLGFLFRMGYDQAKANKTNWT